MPPEIRVVVNDEREDDAPLRSGPSRRTYKNGVEQSVPFPCIYGNCFPNLDAEFVSFERQIIKAIHISIYEQLISQPHQYGR